MRELIEQIILLAEARNVEEESILLKHDPKGMGIRGDNIEFRKEPRPKDKELENFLAGLTQEQLEYIATVMYGGRDFLTYGERPSFERVLAGIKGDLHLDDMIGEKVPLPEYLQAGMKIYKI